VFSQLQNNDIWFGFSGTITLPVSSPNYSHLQSIDVLAVDPSSNITEVVQLNAPFSGSTVNYSGLVNLRPLTTQNWTLLFVVSNEVGSTTSGAFTLTPVSVHKVSDEFSSVSGAAVTGSRYQDSLQGLHFTIELTVVVAGVLPTIATLWMDFADGRGAVWQGWWKLDTVGQQIRIGDRVAIQGLMTPGDIWVPPPGQGTWRVYAFPGGVSKNPTFGGGGDVVPTGAVTSNFSVPVVGQCLPNDVSGARFNNDPDTTNQIDYALQDPGTWHWVYYQLQFTQPTLDVDPNYWFTFLTVQKGHTTKSTVTVSVGGIDIFQTGGATFTADQVGNDVHIAGVLTKIATFVNSGHITVHDAQPAGSGKTCWIWNQAIDYEGADDNEPNNIYKGRWVTDSGQYQGTVSIPGTTVFLNGDQPASWTLPATNNPDGSTFLDVEFRFRLYCASHRADSQLGLSDGFVLQTSCWPSNGDGSQDYTTLLPTPSSTTPALDLRRISPTNSIDKGLTQNGISLKLLTKLAATGGLTFDGFGNNIANLGYTMTVNGSGQIVLDNLQVVSSLPTLPSSAYPAGAVILLSTDNKIYRNPSGTAWLLSAAPGDLVAGAVASGVTIAAAQITAGTLTAGVIYAGVIAASQIAAGTISASLTLTAPTLVITSGSVTVNIDGTNIVLVTDTGTHRQSHVNAQNFRNTDTSTLAETTVGATTITIVNNNSSPTVEAVLTDSQLQLLNSGGTTYTEMTNSHFRVQANADGSRFSQMDLAQLVISGPSGTQRVALSPTGFEVDGLPSSNPGAGTKQFWYDPSDGNRVKFAP
jgi:hypothetical protein